MQYERFLKSKRRHQKPSGFEAGDLPSQLFDWQSAIVQWACRQGRCALFLDTGLGKTACQLAWADQVVKHTGGRVLILAPLAVSHQTQREGKKFGIDVQIVARQSEVSSDICVTNYEKFQHFDSSRFIGVVLDESSILKAYMGKTRLALTQAFRDHRYRLSCTATPSPNDHLELGNQCEFLGVMPSNEMISRWFINDSMKAGGYRLKKMAARDFWEWVSSWAVSIRLPSDLGYPDDGFILPPINYEYHEVAVNSEPQPGMLFHVPEDLSATNIHRVMRSTCEARCSRVAALVDGSQDSWLLWCSTNYEADELLRQVPDSVDIRGSMSDGEKESRLLGFIDGDIKRLVTKPRITGFGLNFQHCHNNAFAGLSYSYEDVYQATRRTWRFGQKSPVNCHVVYAESEGAIRDVLSEKESRHEELKREMILAMSKSQKMNVTGRRKLQRTVKPTMVGGNGWALWHGDCCDVVKTISDESVGHTVFSPPFSSLYIYSDSMADLGNSKDDEEFFEHFDYLIPELLRVTIPGRLCAIHVKDLPCYFGRDGSVGLRDFPGECIRHFEAAGWQYHSRVTIWKCPVIERERTNNNGLLHKTIKRDSSQSRMGMADYVIAFRKSPPDTIMSDAPVEHAEGLSGYVGECDPTTEEHPSPFARTDAAGVDRGLQIWRRYAEPVWWDINQTNVLDYRSARTDKDERHICPLQLDVIERCLQLWSNPGDLVLSPFAGIGSEGYVAVKMGRHFVGVELKESYVDSAVKHLKRAESERVNANRTLFDMVPDAVEETVGG